MSQTEEVQSQELTEEDLNAQLTNAFNALFRHHTFAQVQRILRQLSEQKDEHGEYLLPEMVVEVHIAKRERLSGSACML